MQKLFDSNFLSPTVTWKSSYAIKMNEWGGVVIIISVSQDLQLMFVRLNTILLHYAVQSLQSATEMNVLNVYVRTPVLAIVIYHSLDVTMLNYQTSLSIKNQFVAV